MVDSFLLLKSQDSTGHNLRLLKYHIWEFISLTVQIQSELFAQMTCVHRFAVFYLFTLSQVRHAVQVLWLGVLRSLRYSYYMTGR